MGHDVVDAVGEGALATMLGAVGLLQCTRDEAVASVGDQSLCLLTALLLETVQGKVSGGQQEAPTCISV